MNKIGNLPWKLTFSYGRALQHAPQTTWKGKSENVAAAQRAFAHGAKMNGLAALGQWKSDMEKKAAYRGRRAKGRGDAAFCFYPVACGISRNCFVNCCRPDRPLSCKKPRVITRFRLGRSPDLFAK